MHKPSYIVMNNIALNFSTKKIDIIATNHIPHNVSINAVISLIKKKENPSVSE